MSEPESRLAQFRKSPDLSQLDELELIPEAEEPASSPAAPSRPSGLHYLITAALDAVMPPALLAREPGSVALVAIEVPSNAWVKPTAIVFLRRFPVGWFPIDRDGSLKTTHRAEVGGDEVVGALAHGRSVFGVAPSLSILPAALTVGADFTLRLQIDTAVLIRAIALFTRDDTPLNREVDVRALDLMTIAAAFRPGSTSDEIIARLEQNVKALRVLPAENAVDLRDAVEFGDAQRWGLQLVADFERWQRGELPWSAVSAACIFHGPPGTGKTTIARSIFDAIARVSHSPVQFASASVADIFSATNGFLNEVIKEARRVNRTPPIAVIFWDELDVIGSRGKGDDDRNGRYWSTLLSELLLSVAAARSTPGIVILGAANYVENIDPALRRPGRFDRSIYIGPPDEVGIEGIARRHLRGDLAGVDLAAFAAVCVGRTAAQIEALVRDAHGLARQDDRPIELTDLMIAAVPPSALPEHELERTCIHEAGHVVAGLAVGHDELLTVVVGRQPGSYGETVSRRRSGLTSRETMERRGCVMIAGRCAELVMLGNCVAESGGDDESDLAQLTELLASLAFSCGLGATIAHLGSPKEALEIVKRSPDLRRQVDQHMRQIEERTIGIIQQHRGAVERIASALKERRHLTGAEARILFDNDQEEVR